MPIKAGMSASDKLYEVMSFRGQSYSFTTMSIDGPDETINAKVKEMQAKEFEDVAKICLFIQKEHFRFKLMQERQKQKEGLGNAVIVQKISAQDSIEEEFKEFNISDFVALTFSEEELADIIINNKLEDIEENETKKDRCCAWVLNHCK